MDGAKNSLYSSVFQGILNNIDFPIGDKIIRGVLQRASSASFEMPTGCRDTVRGWGHDPHIAEVMTLQMAQDNFTRQGQWRKDRAIGDPVAVIPQTSDHMF